MAFFHVVYKVVKTIGGLFLLFLICYIVTAISYYSRNNDYLAQSKINEIQNRNIKLIESYDDKEIKITIELYDNLQTEYLIAYVMSYEDIYKKDIHAYLVEDNKIILVSSFTNEATIIEKINRWKNFS